MTRQDLIAKIEAWAEERDVLVDSGLYWLSEDELTLLWVRLQMAAV